LKWSTAPLPSVAFTRSVVPLAFARCRDAAMCGVCGVNRNAFEFYFIYLSSKHSTIVLILVVFAIASVNHKISHRLCKEQSKGKWSSRVFQWQLCIDSVYEGFFSDSKHECLTINGYTNNFLTNYYY